MSEEKKQQVIALGKLGLSLRQIEQARERVLARIGSDTKVIPGHGPVSDRAGLQSYRDMLVGVRAAVAKLVKDYPIHSLNVIAHIRRATVGSRALENTHPFQREMWGRYWTFAHNGTLKEFRPPLEGRYRPVGATDSERAFCYLLERLLAAYPEGTGDLKALHGTIGEVAAYFREHGECNFLLSNGDVLFAHCATNLGYILRRAPFPRAHLVDEDYEVD